MAWGNVLLIVLATLSVVFMVMSMVMGDWFGALINLCSATLAVCLVELHR